ncbi:MAG: anhydro-N-acetylmuramic acid kinase [Spirosomataceae bacterium]|jgi:anhydro-N-acetylmuramic acid kinase
MNHNIQKLAEIAQKPERLILGLMSGTSLDGLDIALCRFRGSGGETRVEVTAFETMPFEEDFKAEIRKIFAKQTIEFEQVCLLNPWIGIKHGELINECLKKWQIEASDIDCIASHGQTVFHAPKMLHGKAKFPNGTLQIGDGDHIAVKTGIITLSDFRQKHCAAGGEGAPLAVYGDYLIFSQEGENRILLNMGGIANFTHLAKNLDTNEVFATDTGTGNTLLDAYVKKYFNLPYDADAKLAKQGEVNTELLTDLKANDFFKKPFPKTTGPELFNLEYFENAQQRSETKNLSHFDVLATLCRFTAETISEAILSFTNSDETYTIYGSGGGVHNPLIMEFISELLPDFALKTTDDLGISSDAKEAVLFATLANEALAGGNTNFGSRKGVPSVSMGKVSFAG